MLASADDTDTGSSESQEDDVQPNQMDIEEFIVDWKDEDTDQEVMSFASAPDFKMNKSAPQLLTQSGRIIYQPVVV
jgi:hypothetical protein